MDARTLAIYDRDAATYCDDWLTQPLPDDLQALWRRYFMRGKPTADIGSGSGRDVDWLNRNGYPCTGWDGSAGLIAEARKRFPQWPFGEARLPALADVPHGKYANVVCETVIMHLAGAEVPAAVHALTRLLMPGGNLYLSWRIADPAESRDRAGRLYSPIDADTVRAALSGLTLLYDMEAISDSSGKRVHRLVARRASPVG